MGKNLEIQHQKAYTFHFFFNHGLFDEIFHLRDFINATDEYLNEKFISKDKPENNGENYNPRFNSRNQFETIFPNILWRTIFLHSYFLFESSLDQICNNIQESEKYALTLRDMNGRGIQRASLYLRKVCKITNPFTTRHWVELMDFNKMRNVFVHSDGLVEMNNLDIIKIASKYQGIVLDDFDSFGVSSLKILKEFTLYSLQCIESFFQNVHSSIQDIS